MDIVTNITRSSFKHTTKRFIGISKGDYYDIALARALPNCEFCFLDSLDTPRHVNVTLDNVNYYQDTNILYREGFDGIIYHNRFSEAVQQYVINIQKETGLPIMCIDHELPQKHAQTMNHTLNIHSFKKHTDNSIHVPYGVVTDLDGNNDDRKYNVIAMAPTDMISETLAPSIAVNFDDVVVQYYINDYHFNSSKIYVYMPQKNTPMSLSVLRALVNGCVVLSLPNDALEELAPKHVTFVQNHHSLLPGLNQMLKDYKFNPEVSTDTLETFPIQKFNEKWQTVIEGLLNEEN